MITQKLKGKYGAIYESSGEFDIKITKSDGKVFFIPRQDIEDFWLLESLTEEKQETIHNLHRIERRINKLTN